MCLKLRWYLIFVICVQKAVAYKIWSQPPIHPDVTISDKESFVEVEIDYTNSNEASNYEPDSGQIFAGFDINDSKKVFKSPIVEQFEIAFGGPKLSPKRRKDIIKHVHSKRPIGHKPRKIPHKKDHVTHLGDSKKFGQVKNHIQKSRGRNLGDDPRARNPKPRHHRYEKNATKPGFSIGKVSRHSKGSGKTHCLGQKSNYNMTTTKSTITVNKSFDDFLTVGLPKLLDRIRDKDSKQPLNGYHIEYISAKIFPQANTQHRNQKVCNFSGDDSHDHFNSPKRTTVRPPKKYIPKTHNGDDHDKGHSLDRFNSPKRIISRPPKKYNSNTHVTDKYDNYVYVNYPNKHDIPNTHDNHNQDKDHNHDHYNTPKRTTSRPPKKYPSYKHDNDNYNKNHSRDHFNSPKKTTSRPPKKYTSNTHDGHNHNKDDSDDYIFYPNKDDIPNTHNSDKRDHFTTRRKTTSRPPKRYPIPKTDDSDNHDKDHMNPTSPRMVNPNLKLPNESRFNHTNKTKSNPGSRPPGTAWDISFDLYFNHSKTDQHSNQPHISTTHPPQNHPKFNLSGPNTHYIIKNHPGSQRQRRPEDISPSHMTFNERVFNYNPFRDCQGLQKSGLTESNFYEIYPKYDLPVTAKCDMETLGGGWTYVLNRRDGSQNFNMSWEDYKNGFGDLGEFWLGLEYLHILTGNTPYELLIILTDSHATTVYAFYDAFSVGSEKEGYAITHLDGYTGTAGNSWKNSVGTKFTTNDRDQDDNYMTNCAQLLGGGWWYKNCKASSLTGRYHVDPKHYFQKTLFWQDFAGSKQNLREVKMLIRPRKGGYMKHFTSL